MADQNEIEFKVRVTDAGLPKLAENLDKVEAETKQLGSTAEKTGDSLSEVGRTANDSLGTTSTEARKAGQSLQTVEQNAKSAGFELNKVAGAVAGAFAIDRLIDYGKSVNQIADDYKNLESRVRLAVGPHADLQAAVQGVADVATRTFSNLDATEALYSRLAASAKELKISNGEALGLTETINQAIQVSGASAQASESSVRQLVQGLQSGVLRGDEFNSVMEQAPRLAKALADGLGVPVGKLREMAEAGELTSARIVTALKGQADAINNEFSTLPLTTGRALEKLNTQWTIFIGNLSGGSKEASVVAKGISALADNLDEIAEVAERAGAVLTVALAVKGAAALRAYAAEVLAAKTATSLLALEMSKVPTAINVTVGFIGLEAGYRFGSWLHENTETARQLGVELVGFAEKNVNSLIFMKEALAAVFTGDTVEAAYERWQLRTVKLQQTLQTMREDAKKAPAEWQAEADAAAAKLGTVASSAEAAGTKVSEAGAKGAEGIGKIKDATDGAKTVLQELEKAVSEFNLSDSMGISKAGKELREMLNSGKITADQFGAAWSKALAKNPDLVKFEQDAKAAFTGVEGGARLLSDAMDAGLREAIRRSGADFDLLAGGIGKAAQSAVNDTDLIIGNLDALRSKGIDTGRALEVSLAKAINTADGQKAVDELRQRIELMRAQLGDKVADGLLSDLQAQAEKLGATFEQLPAKAKTQAERVAQAFKDAGIQMQADGKKSALELAQNYELIKGSGKASAEDLGKAWRQWAEASIAANGGVASDTMRAEAAMHGLKIEVDETGKAIVKNMSDGARAADGLADSIDNASAAAQRYKGWADRMADRNAGVGKLPPAGRTAHNGEELGEGVTEVGSGGQYKNRDGFASDAKGTAIVMGSELATLTGIKNFLQQAGLNEEQAKRVALEFSDGRGNIPYFSNPGQKKYGGEFSTISDALLKAAERTTFGMGGSGGQAIGGSTTHNVNVNVGGKRRSFNAASAEDAASAASVFKEIEVASRR